MNKLMKYCLLACLALAAFFIFADCKGNPSSPEEVFPEPATSRPKIVAYLPSWKVPYTIDWTKITHVCLAFGFVNADGSLNTDEVRKMTNVIEQAHQHKVSVLLSIGGGGSKNFTSAILNPSYRKTLVDRLVMAVNEMNLDGVDVDYEEWDGGPGGFGEQDIQRQAELENLYKELKAALPKGKLITAAVNASWDNGGWGYYNCFNNSMHQYLDFVSLMIYDLTGPWSGTKVGPHSGWDFFENSINHWINNRQLPKEKLVAGVPFYGYLFQSPNDATGAESIPYKDILVNFPNVQADQLDSIGLLYYDGVPTIRKKAEYLKNNGLGGIMFWEITQDTNNPEKSLLNVINQVFDQQ